MTQKRLSEPTLDFCKFSDLTILSTARKSPGKCNKLTRSAHKFLPRQKSRLRLPRIKRTTRIEDQSDLGQGDKATWELRGGESKIQT
jgi:hypothetical protein